VNSDLIQRLKNRLRLHQAYKSIFNTPDGELVLEHLMRESGILSPKITVDFNSLLVKEGQKHIVLSILRILGRDVNKLTKQIQESMAHEDE
jgi:hypothetical protein